MMYLVKLAVSAALVALLVILLDVRAALAQLAAVEPGHAALALALYLGFHAVGAVKLKTVLPQRRARSLFAYILVAQAYALLLPGQLAGEAMKAYRLARGAGAAAAQVVSSVTFDKLTALAALLLTTLIGLVADGSLFGDGLAVVVAVCLAGMLGLAAMLALEPTRRLSRALLDDRRAGWRGRLAGHADGFLYAWRRHAGQPRVIAMSVAWGIAAQLVQALASQTLGLGFGVDIGFAQWCVIIGVLTVVLLAPVTIGGIGLREASIVGLLGPFGVEQDRALAIALAILAIQIVIAAIGLAVDLLALRDR